jgi:hypothetical protein
MFWNLRICLAFFFLASMFNILFAETTSQIKEDPIWKINDKDEPTSNLTKEQMSNMTEEQMSNSIKDETTKNENRGGKSKNNCLHCFKLNYSQYLDHVS